MLASVSIRDFALIEELRLDFGRGFNVLTGETGAGKTIIIDAIALLLGERATPEAIRSGASSAYVEGIFEMKDARHLEPALAELGIETDDGQAIISRELTPSRSVARVNGRAVALRDLQRLGQALVDIHGQSEQLSLLRPGRQLEFLDDFAALNDSRRRVGELVEERRRLKREIASLAADGRELAREVDLLRFQVQEIQSASLDPDEEAELLRERKRLAHGRRLIELARAVESALAPSDTGRTAADLIGRSVDRLAEMAELDQTVAPRLEQLQAAAELLDELSGAMRGYAEAVDDDPQRLHQVESRLELLANLKHKYGETVEQVIGFGERASLRLDGIAHSGERLAQLHGQLERADVDLSEIAAGLSEGRKESARRLTGEIHNGLRDLGMRQAKFAVEFATEADEGGIELPGVNGRVRVDETGADRVVFAVSPNPGEELKPLASIASGGETSRIMLALKAALSDVDRTPTLIFDEVDQGIGGRSASVVGEKLGMLAGKHQVLCVTHLPQVAAYADVHFLIEKSADGERTITTVRRLEGEESLTELAQMTGPGAGARRAASEMIQKAMDWKAGKTRARKVAG